MSESFRRGTRPSKSRNAVSFERPPCDVRTIEALRAAAPNVAKVASRMGFNGAAQVYRWLSGEVPNPLWRFMQFTDAALEVAAADGETSREDALAGFLLLQERYGDQLAGEYKPSGTTAAAFGELLDVVTTTGHAGQRLRQWMKNNDLDDEEFAEFMECYRTAGRQWAELLKEMEAANARHHQERGDEPTRKLRGVKG